MKFLLGLTCITLTVLTLTGCEKESAQQPKEPTVKPATPVEKEPAAAVEVKAAPVTVNGQPISEDMIAAEVNKRVEAMKKRAPEGQPFPDDQKNRVRMGVIDLLVQQTALNQLAEKHNVSVSDEKVMEEITKIAEQQGKTLDEVQAEISGYGMTMDDLKSQVRPQIVMKELADAFQNDEAMASEAKTFYDANPNYFEKPEQVRASHVLIKMDPAATEEEKAAVKAKAEEVLAKAKAGDDFAALAKEYSEDPGSKDKGGEYTFGRGKMVKPFEDTAFALEVGAVSDLVETQFGYHIIKLSEKMEAITESLEDAKPKIISFLLQKQLREGTKVEYSAAEQALRDSAAQQQQMQQQMMQQIQAQMAQQGQTEKPADDTAKTAVEVVEKTTEKAAEEATQK